MKNLHGFEEEIYKCSRCGLCQSVCPVFKATMNECAVSRGKFNILNGVIKGDLKMTDKVKSYLDLCTGCNACKDFCPSGIDAREIFIAAKQDFYSKNEISFRNKLINSYELFKFSLLCAGLFGKILKIFKITRLIKLLESVFIKTGYLGKRLVLFNSLFCFSVKNRTKCAHKNALKTAIYFDGCFNKYIDNATKTAVVNILANSGITTVNKKFECCGVSYLHDGDIRGFKKLIQKNLQQLDVEYDYLITDCSSCNYVLKKYNKYDDSENSKILSNKVVSALDLMKNLKFTANKKYTVAVHKPCHDDYDFIDVVKNIEGINFVEVDDFDKCCGFSGKFAIQNQNVSIKISTSKAQQYVDSGVDYIITTCPACLLGLNQGLAEIDSPHKPIPINLFVFLSEYCRQSFI